MHKRKRGGLFECQLGNCLILTIMAVQSIEKTDQSYFSAT